ncbi:MAG: transposase [Phycisphaerae bacterium]|nr:transposase [Phycisphaerae bacterium]
MIEDMKTPKKKEFLATERAEPQRSGGEANAVAKNGELIPDPEVLAQPKRRRFTAAYKVRIVEEAQKCTDSGQIGALLRREGLYSSSLTSWRRQYKNGALKGLKEENRGRKRKADPRDLELEQLRRENERLTKNLSQAELIIDIQKKVSAILNVPISQPNEENS